MYIAITGLWQTILVILSPFLLPRLIRLIQRFLNPQPKGTRTPLHQSNPIPIPPLRPEIALTRRILIIVSCSYSLVKALIPPENLFLTLAKSESVWDRSIPLLRKPLDLRLATEPFMRTWIKQLGRKPTEIEGALVTRLQSLDARLTYVTFGPRPMMHCAWCRPSSASDYLLLLLPSIMLGYLVVAALISILLIPQGRSRWRTYFIYSLLIAFAFELYLRWSNPVSSQPFMVDSFLQMFKPLLTIPLLLIAYFASPTPILPSTAQLLLPTLASLIQSTEQTLASARASTIQRLSILHHSTTRGKVIEFWETDEMEKEYVLRDRTVRELVKDVVISESDKVGFVPNEEVEAFYRIGSHDAPLPEIEEGLKVEVKEERI